MKIRVTATWELPVGTEEWFDESELEEAKAITPDVIPHLYGQEAMEVDVKIVPETERLGAAE